MNKSILITGANIGLGKETARQLALKEDTEKIILACRNLAKAEAAKKDLETTTGRSIFEIVIMDTSDAESVRTAVSSLNEPIDTVILNAGGMGGKTPGKLTDSGMNELAASNVLGHVVLIEELLKNDKLKETALLASTEAVRGIKKMGMHRPSLKTSSVDEFASILDGTYFGDKLDAMQAYGHVKYVATMWMSSLSRKYPHIKFISMSPGATSGTAAPDELPAMSKIMFKYIMMPIVMPLRGMIHSLDKGARRFVDGISKELFESGRFYASHDGKVVGKVVDQSTIFSDLANPEYQENAEKAIHRFIR